jgi:hypothetical protein
MTSRMFFCYFWYLLHVIVVLTRIPIKLTSFRFRNVFSVQHDLFFVQPHSDSVGGIVLNSEDQDTINWNIWIFKDIELNCIIFSKNRGFTKINITKKSKHHWLLNINFVRSCHHQELQLTRSILFFFVWYLTWILDFYYHNVSPRAYAKILWIVLFVLKIMD